MSFTKDWLFYILAVVGAGLVLYLSWQPQPQMAAVWFIPKWLATWADENRNDTFRTAIPFVALGWLAGGWLAKENSPWRHWLLAWSVLIGLVIVAEVGQLFLTKRSFDLGDIGWGTTGALLGLGTMAALLNLYARSRKAA